MKSLYTSLAAASLLLLVGACSNEEPMNGTQNEGNTSVTFAVESPAGMRSRAYADGTTAVNLTYAVYDMDGKYLGITGSETMSNLKTTVKLNLSVQKTYQVMFFAQSGTTYTLDLDNATMTMPSSVSANDENLDAFFKADIVTVSQGLNKTVTLTRPFAQLNIGTDDVKAAENAGFTLSQTQVKVTDVPNTMNLLTGVTSGNTDITYTYGNVPTTETFPVDKYEYLSMSYVLMSTDKAITNVTLNINDAAHERVYTSVPLQRNYRTNIYGSLLTSNVTANIEILPGFEEPDYNKEIKPEEPDPEPELEMVVGSYVDATGKVVESAKDAIGIVFKLGAIGNDVPANYPEALQGKTIKGYAVALENTSAQRAKYYKEAFKTTEASITNGTQTTATILTLFLDDFQTAYNTWVANHTLTGENLSAWYIPTLTQLEQFIYSLYANGTTSKDTPDESKLNATLKAMSEFAIENLNDNLTKNANYISSTVNPSAAVSSIRIYYDKETKSFPYASSYGTKTGDQVFCRPMITIFE